MGCHQAPGLTMTLQSGEKMPLSVDQAGFAGSVHGQKITCLACHSDVTSFPHKSVTAPDRRAYQLQRYESCKGCHFKEYTRELDSTHNLQLEAGNRSAPVCTDCHGSHNIGHPDVPRANISHTCSACHAGINKDYAESVHGKALTDPTATKDVPVCTSCHGVHQMVDPRTARFRMESPEMCAGCHSDPAVMDKYGISTNVLNTYLQDFHGVSISFSRRQDPNSSSLKAVCTDCHGVHDIKKTDDPESRVIKANLVKTCQQCHPDATTNFPTAWLKHYTPSPARFPIVFLVRAFYWIITPIVVLGVGAHVLLDLWRALANRRRTGGAH